MSKKYSKTTSMLWAGTPESFEAYCEAISLAGSGYTMPANPEDDDEDEIPSLLTMDGSLAIITVHGTLTNEDSWWNEYRGLVSYNSIRQAVYYAATSEKVDEILLDVASPGGTVYGVMDAAQAVANAAAMKPVTMFSDSVVASGAFWALAAPAAERYISAAATAGSIGVLNIHQEISKMLEEAGVSTTIFRSGKYKALGLPYEPLSALAKEEIQGRADYLSGIFEKDVSEYLGVSEEIVASKMGQGRVFIGQQAVDVGLVDGISNFDDVVAAIHARIRIDKETGGKDMKKKVSLAAFQALAASGGNVAAVEVETPVTPTAEELAAAAAAEAATTTTTTEELAAAAAEAAKTPEVPAESEVVKLLKEQLAARDEALMAAKIENKQLTDKVADLPALMAVITAATNNMIIALGGSADPSLDKMDAKALLVQYESVKGRLMQLPVGGAASPHAESAEDVVDAKPTRKAVAQNKVVNIK